MSYPPPPGPGYGYGYPQPRSSNAAVWSLVLGILGMVCCSPAGVAAIVLGNSAKRQIDASGGGLTGRGMAQAGVVLGIIATVFLVLEVIGVATGVVHLNVNGTSLG